MNAALSILCRTLALAALAALGASVVAQDPSTSPLGSNAAPASLSVPPATNAPAISTNAPSPGPTSADDTSSDLPDAGKSSSGSDRDATRSRRSDRDRRKARSDTTNTAFSASAATNRPASGIEFPSFQLIADRNIFNANRSARASRAPREPAPKAVVVETLALVGSMSYSKGDFAFFDGSSSEFRKVLKAGDAIAGFALKTIGRNSAQLEAEGKTIELAIGSHLRRQDAGEWQLVAEAAPDSSSSSSNRESRSGSDSSSGSGDSSTPSAATGGDANDILQRLMKKREQELK